MTEKNGKRLINFAVFLNFVKVYHNKGGHIFPFIRASHRHSIVELSMLQNSFMEIYALQF